MSARLPVRLLPLAAFVAIAGLLVAVAVFLRRDYREPNFEPLPADMVYSPSPRAGAVTADYPEAFADGVIERAPPEGTIARGLVPYDYPATPEGQKRAGEELQNPFEPTKDNVARGGRAYANFCATCHGLGGAGDGPVAKRGFPPPPPLSRPETKALKDGALFHQVTYGGKNMPGHAGQMDRDERWLSVLYVRELQKKAVPPPKAPPAPPGAAPGKEPGK